VKSLEKIVRSVQAFGRELSGQGSLATRHKDLALGIALGGGFARGIAHIGVLKVLEQENIPIRFVAGTSVGALIGAAYCSGVSAEELEDVATRVRFKTFARWTISRMGFADNQRMVSFLNTVLKVKTFEELRIPLAVAATDFSTGDGVVFRSGPLIDPVRASCAYPGMFLPVKINGRLLVDGMLAHAVPTRPLRDMGAERVLGVHLVGHWTNKDGPRHLFDVIGQCFSIAQEMNCGVWKQAADLVIEPDVNGYKYDDFEHSAELVKAGEATMRAALPEIRKWLQPAHSPMREKKRQTQIAQPAAMPAD
jgi:NTE family protein